MIHIYKNVERTQKDMIDKIKSECWFDFINYNQYKYILIISNLTQYILRFFLKLKVEDAETLSLIFFDCIG